MFLHVHVNPKRIKNYQTKEQKSDFLQYFAVISNKINYINKIKNVLIKKIH